VWQRQQKGGEDGRLYSKSMSELASAKIIIDAGSLDKIASTEMVDQLGLGKLKQDAFLLNFHVIIQCENQKKNFFVGNSLSYDHERVFYCN